MESQETQVLTDVSYKSEKSVLVNARQLSTQKGYIYVFC
jgi:hypothetical protein